MAPLTALHAAREWMEEKVNHSATPKPIRNELQNHIDQVEAKLRERHPRIFKKESNRVKALEKVRNLLVQMGAVDKETPLTQIEKTSLQVPKLGFLGLFSKAAWTTPLYLGDIDVNRNPGKALAYLERVKAKNEEQEQNRTQRDETLSKVRDFMARQNLGGITHSTPLEQVERMTVQSTRKGWTTLFTPGYWGGRIHIGNNPEQALKLLQREHQRTPEGKREVAEVKAARKEAAIQELRRYMIQKGLIQEKTTLEEFEKSRVRLGGPLKRWLMAYSPEKDPEKLLALLKRQLEK